MHYIYPFCNNLQVKLYHGTDEEFNIMFTGEKGKEILDKYNLIAYNAFNNKILRTIKFKTINEAAGRKRGCYEFI